MAETIRVDPAGDRASPSPYMSVLLRLVTPRGVGKGVPVINAFTRVSAGTSQLGIYYRGQQ